MKADTASGKMSAQSKDSFAIYQLEQGIKGTREAIADNKSASLQMKSDKAGLQRQLKRLEIAEARLKADKSSGKMAAESKDSIAVDDSRKAVTGGMNAVAAP